MFHKTIILFGVLLACALTPIFSYTIRESVVIVRPKVAPSAIKTYTAIADYFKDQGNKDAADYYRSFADGWFGSGFLVRLADGRVVVLTNRHVVEQSESAELTFVDDSGVKTVVPDCPILYIDPVVDVALVGMPENAKFTPLLLASTVPADGADIWAAGYPGLMARPSYQLTKGIITNHELSVPELGPKDDAIFIQHSASIDPGNSGGPLFVGDPSDQKSIKVIGINTWTATGRRNTFFAVTLKKITDTLSRYTATQKAATDQKKFLEDSAKTLARFLNNPTWDENAFYQSFSDASALGALEPMFDDMRTMSTADRKTWYERFDYDPVNSLRQFASWKLWKSISTSASAIEYTRIVEQNENGTATVEYTQKGQTLQYRWIREAGRWLYQEPFDSSAAATKSAQKSETDADPATFRTILTPVGGGVYGGVGFAPPDAIAKGPTILFGIDGNGKIAPNLSCRGVAEFASDYMLNADKPFKTTNNYYSGFNFGSGLQYALTSYNAKGFISPFIGATLLVQFPLNVLATETSSTNGITDDDVVRHLMALTCEARIGVECSFNKVWSFGIAAGVRYGLYGFPGLRNVPVEVFLHRVNLQ